MAGDADPVCQFSPHHGVIVDARREGDEPEPAEPAPFVYRDLIPQ